MLGSARFSRWRCGRELDLASRFGDAFSISSRVHSKSLAREIAIGEMINGIKIWWRV